MERRQSLVVGGIVLLIVAVGYVLYMQGFWGSHIPTLNQLEGEISLDDLQYDSYITSPLTFSGLAASEWFDSNGAFAVEVRDTEGEVIGTGMAQASGGVAGSAVSFTASVTFAQPTTEKGTVWLFRTKTFGNEDSFSYGVSVSFVPVPEEVFEIVEE